MFGTRKYELRDKLCREATQLRVLIEGIDGWKDNPAYHEAHEALQKFVQVRAKELKKGTKDPLPR